MGNYYNLTKSKCNYLLIHESTKWLTFNIVDDKLRLQSKYFDLIIVLRNFAPNGAMEIFWFVTHDITDQIVLHSVQSPLLMTTN